VERQGADGDTEECIPAQHFHVPVIEIEGLMWNYGCGVNEGLILEGGVRGRLIIGSICGREVGQSGDADGWRLNDGCDGRFRNYALP